MRFQKTGLLVVTSFALVLASVLLVERRSIGISRDDKVRATPPPATASKNLTLSVSNAPADMALAREIDRAIDEGDLAQARWGVFVMSLSGGRVLYSRNGDKLFTPASNMKIYTTAAALDLLGADYRWRTSVYSDKQPDNGVIDGDVTLYGRGDPGLDSYRKDGLPVLALELWEHGVRRVRGNVIGDESYFRGEMYGLGWQWNDVQWYFGAEPSALTIDANAMELTIAPGSKFGNAATVKLQRENSYFHLTNNTTTGERAAPATIGINRGLSDNEIRVWGEFPAGGRGFTAYLSVYNPALWAATLFKEALLARGIKVDGEPRSRDFRTAAGEKFDPQKAFEIALAEGRTLGEIVRETNKESNNLYAELILRTLGKERGATAPDPDARKNRERGDDEAGVAVVRSWLDSNGIPTNGLAIRDGSGLSRLDLVTPEATARLLVAVTKTNSASVFHDSLPIAGRDGTLKPRLLREAGKVFAKTGSLTYDHSLSGYATTQNNEVLAFSVFCNDATGHSDPVRRIDEIARLLVAYDTPSPTK
ncbi:MAG TPA: D-alanyl-D-alanine carboxypeptidase/D-alanyl-D-alanine-endopeptidase [Pyrinomonadaceae bacterium]|nr:D-alanyl-D-alanine carboxypeptidase/D-alanyl-D-alanine-endopeptidase [Pyrinomonadaceae bacterium]